MCRSLLEENRRSLLHFQLKQLDRCALLGSGEHVIFPSNCLQGFINIIFVITNNGDPNCNSHENSKEQLFSKTWPFTFLYFERIFPLNSSGIR